MTPSCGWNPLLQPELDGSHVKQTQLKYRRSRYLKTQHFLESFERMGGTFLVMARSAETVAVICTESITVPRNNICWLGDSIVLAKLTLCPRQSKWLRRRVLCDVKTACDWARMSQSTAVFEYADSHLSQRGESRIHASSKSAESQGQPKRQDLVLIFILFIYLVI